MLIMNNRFLSLNDYNFFTSDRKDKEKEFKDLWIKDIQFEKDVLILVI